jgi:hexosaminidase
LIRGLILVSTPGLTPRRQNARVRRGLAATGLATLLACGLTSGAARAAAPLPLVPALQSWSPTSGSFELRRDARVVVRRGEPATLRGEARTLAADLGELIGHRVGIAAHTRRGDVLLTLTSRDPGLGDEGYSLRIGRAFTIAAHTSAGVFYGGRTLLELRRLGAAIPRGRARDFPRYSERGLMIDDGRVFFSRAWLERRIRALSDLKLNLLHLHFSDDQGFRIESKSHPEVVTKPALSQDDVRALVAFARRRHVTIVPEIDMPGHMTAALAKHPELQLTNAAGQKQPDKLDVTLPAARKFAADLVGEYMKLFPGPWWHMGSDEYLGAFSTQADYNEYPQLQAYSQSKYGASANGKDAVLDFVNAIDNQVRAAGKHLRIWSDGMTGGAAVKLDPDISVEWWENRSSPTPQELVAAGRRVLNVGWWPLYYVTGGTFKMLRSSEADFYEQWQPWHFEGPYTARWVGGPPQFSQLPPDDPLELGATLAVWNDDPSSPDATEAAIAQGIAPRLRILAQKTWGSPPFATGYADFASQSPRATGPLTP